MTRTFESGDSYQRTDETTALIAPSNGAEKKSSEGLEYRSIKKKRGFLMPLLVGIIMVTAVSMAVLLYRHQVERKRASESARSYLQSLVGVSHSGKYVVTYPRNITKTDTFADLAKVMIPVWFEASLLSLSVFDDSVNPSDVHNARKCLLTTRDLLDAFSPVYTNRTRVWDRLRRQYKQGYEIAGSFQDLHDGNVTYDKHLWHKRRDALLVWRHQFEAFVERRNFIRTYLLHPSADGCYTHKEVSHLFWAGADRPPCGNDLARSSLQQLAVLQLNNALDYLNVILGYNKVLSREHQLEYHNFRKELRSFLDEYKLFGFVLFPSAIMDELGKEEVSAAIHTLKKSRKLLGKLNDHWEAFNLNRKKESEKEAQAKLADRIEEEWMIFKTWCQDKNLAGAIQTLAHALAADECTK
uniref:Uncharacterized protein n=1 Tax=Amphora coffeiformis TaxID=265554 RepID=A0A7S3KWR2_9STRA